MPCAFAILCRQPGSLFSVQPPAGRLRGPQEVVWDTWTKDDRKLYLPGSYPAEAAAECWPINLHVGLGLELGLAGIDATLLYLAARSEDCCVCGCVYLVCLCVLLRLCLCDGRSRCLPLQGHALLGCLRALNQSYSLPGPCKCRPGMCLSRAAYLARLKGPLMSSGAGTGIGRTGPSAWRDRLVPQIDGFTNNGKFTVSPFGQ
jgi:hypothetical protein